MDDIAVFFFLGAGALFGLAVLIWVIAFSRIDGLRNRVGVLERRLAQWRTVPSGAAIVAPEPVPQAAPIPQTIPTVAAAVSEAPPFPEPAAQFVPEDVPSQSSSQVPHPAARAWFEKPASAIDWEMFAGGRFFNVVGAIVLIIGVGLFMKYAFDNNWIGAPLRVLAGVVAGAATLAVAARAHRKQKAQGHAWFSEGLFGAGLGILYVSGYAAFASYHLVSFVFAFGCMSCVTFVALAIAIRYGSLAIAVIGWAGGFITPFAMGLGNADQTSLAAYILFLDAGLTAVALLRRRWFVLEPLALFASYMVAIAWYVNHAHGASVFVSSIALLSLWAVRFVSGVCSAMFARDGDARGRTAVRAIVDLTNAITFWVSASIVLAGHDRAFACVQFGICVAYALAYANVVKRVVDRAGLRARYVLGSASFFAGSVCASAPHADVSSVFAMVAIALALFGYRFASMHEVAGREAACASIGFFGLAALWCVASPGFGLFAGPAWSFALGSRDATLASLALAGFACDRLLRRALPSSVPGVVLRQASLVAILAVEIAHFRDYELSCVIIATGVALAIVHALFRARGLSYAPAVESVAAAFGLLGFGALALALGPDALAPASGSFDFRFGSRDIALAFTAIAAFVFDRAWRSDRPVENASRAFRLCTIVAIVLLELSHAHGLGFVTCAALTAMFVLAFDRTLRAVGSAYAAKAEVAYTASGTLAVAWLALVANADRLGYAGLQIFVGFGTTDSTLVVLAVSAAVLARVARHDFRHAIAVLRQSIVLAGVLAAVVHADGLAFWAILGCEGLLCAIIGTRILLRDVEVDGLALFVVSLVGMLFEPTAWHARDLLAFVPLHDERALALPIIGVAAILAGECYRRPSLLPVWLGRSLRLAGVGTIVFSLTGELRDGFEHAILAAGPTAVAIANVRDGESLAVSALWILASVIVVTLGIALKLKDFRIAAIALFDVTILKAFFLDLGSLAAPYRILSFIGLGLTLLAVSYAYQRLERRDGDPSGAAMRGARGGEPPIASEAAAI